METIRRPGPDPEPPRADLPLRVQVPLVHAVVEAIAATVACPVLHLKGPVLAHQLEVDRPSSTDVDVLVAPSRRPELVAALRRHGWRVAVPAAAGRAVMHHAVVLVHPLWTCAVDLHDRFPGVEAPPEEAFDILWSRRSAVAVAGVAVDAPGRADHALLLLLHAARGRGRWSAARDATYVRDRLDRLETAALVAAAGELRANAAAATVVPGLIRGGSSGADLHWWLRSRRPDGASLWTGRFLAARDLRTRGAVLRAALFPGTRVPSRWRRWARGVRDLPAAVRAVRTARAELGAPPAIEVYDASAADRARQPVPARTCLPSVAHVEDHDALWAVALPSGRAFRLDGTGRLVWEVARAGTGAEGVIQDVAQLVGLPAHRVAADVMAFLDRLMGLGLLRPDPGP